MTVGAAHVELGQGVAQMLSDVPLTAGEIVAKMAGFAVLTFVAGVLLMRLARSHSALPRSALPRRALSRERQQT